MPNGGICGGAVDGSNQLGEIVTCQAIVTRPDGAATAAVEAIAPRVATATSRNWRRAGHMRTFQAPKRSHNWNGLPPLSADCDRRFGRQPADPQLPVSAAHAYALVASACAHLAASSAGMPWIALAYMSTMMYLLMTSADLRSGGPA